MATRNRLEELQQISMESEKQKGGFWKKAKSEKQPENASIMDQLEATRNLIHTLESNTKTCEETYKKAVKAKGLHKKLKETFGSSEAISMNIAQNLKAIKAFLKDCEHKQSAEFRMQFIQYHSLVERFKEAVRNYHEWMERVHEVEKKFIKKCYQIANHEPLDDEELAQLIQENPNIFTQDYVKNEIEARRQLADVEERQNELKIIEEHLIEIRGLFAQIATLIEQQQENVNRIDFLTAQIGENVDDSAGILRKAKKQKIRNRKLFAIITIIIVVFVIIVFASIFHS